MINKIKTMQEPRPFRITDVNAHVFVIKIKDHYTNKEAMEEFLSNKIIESYADVSFSEFEWHDNTVEKEVPRSKWEFMDYCSKFFDEILDIRHRLKKTKSA